MGRTHAGVLARDPRVLIAGVADPEPDRAQRLAAELGVPTYRDLDALLRAGLDLLVIATPNRHHSEAALAALERDVGVLCEKPMAINLPDARRVCEAAARPGAFYVVAHNRRHAPVYRRVQALLREGFRPLLASFKMHEGDFRTPPWVSDRSVSGGFLYENLVHFFDLMEWLVAPIAEVVEAYLADRRPCFSAARALRSLEIAETCAQAAREARPVRPGPPPTD